MVSTPTALVELACDVTLRVPLALVLLTRSALLVPPSALSTVVVAWWTALWVCSSKLKLALLARPTVVRALALPRLVPRV